ncbi:MAG TPA: hypothetical protein PK147_12600, partial [Saprospiraceae bacterium]|nr:hypothetical protein [Saprospiraceae bacterium]
MKNFYVILVMTLSVITSTLWSQTDLKSKYNVQVDGLDIQFSILQADPCDCTQRWTQGGSWNPDGSVNDSPPNSAPYKGIIKCSSSAETQSGIEPLPGCTYDSTNPIVDIDVSSTPCYSPNTGLEVDIPNPQDGCEIIWLNFDVRPTSSSYEYQIVTNDEIGWALYYSNVSTQAIGSNGFSGDCSDLSYFACGNNFDNTFVNFEVPTFPLSLNLYLAVWRTDPDDCLSSNGNQFSFNFKARYGCGDGDA